MHPARIIALGALAACTAAPQEPVSQDQAVEICRDEAFERGAPELNNPFGPDGLRAEVGLPPFDTNRARPERETVYQTCFHRLTGELPTELPPL